MLLLFSNFLQFQSVLFVCLFKQFSFCQLFWRLRYRHHLSPFSPRISDSNLVPRSAYQNSLSDPFHHCISAINSTLRAATETLLFSTSLLPLIISKETTEERNEYPLHQVFLKCCFWVPSPNLESRYDYESRIFRATSYVWSEDVKILVLPDNGKIPVDFLNLTLMFSYGILTMWVYTYR